MPTTSHRVAARAATFVAMSAAVFTTASDASTAVTATPATPTAPIAIDRTAPRQALVSHIDLSLTVDWTRWQLVGRATLDVTTLTATDVIALDAAKLQVSQVRVNDKVAPHSDDGSESDGALKVHLPNKVAAGEPLRIAVDYRTRWVNASDPANLAGSNGKGVRFFEPTPADKRKRQQLWTMGEPHGNRYWFPSIDSPHARRTMRIAVTVGTPFTAIASGELRSTRTNADGTRTFVWEQTRPGANHRAALVVGEYVSFRQWHGSVPFINYAYPDELQATQDSVERLTDMAQYFEVLTGVPYPHTSYSQVFVQDIPWGTGNTMLAIQSENMVDDYNTHAEFLYLWDSLAAEGLAHQWFGNHITPRTWQDTWLARAFALHLDSLYAQHKNGHEGYLLWNHRGAHATYHSDWQSGTRYAVAPRSVDNVANFVGSNYPYVRGQLALHMLRMHLGDARWRRVLAHYSKSHAGRLVTTADVIHAIEEAAGEDLRWFFDQWILGMGHPVFEVAYVYNAAAKQVELTIKQSPASASAPLQASPQFFKGYVDLEIDGRVHRVWLAAHAEQRVTIAHDRAPSYVHFDRENTWIKELKFDKPLAEWLAQLRLSQDVTARDAAIAALLAAARAKDASPATRSSVIAALRDVIGSDAHWRVRLIATNTLRTLVAAGTPGTPSALDPDTQTVLAQVITRDHAWAKAAAINLLGDTRDPRHAPLYVGLLRDKADRVTNAAAIALGKTGSPDAFAALDALIAHPSWKQQSLISALTGMKELGDARAEGVALKALADVTTPRWSLATPIWDVPVAAVDALAAIKRTDKAYALLAQRLSGAMQGRDIYDVFYTVMLLARLGDVRALDLLAPLKSRYRDDPNALKALATYEESLKKSGK